MNMQTIAIGIEQIKMFYANVIYGNAVPLLRIPPERDR